MKVIAVRHIVVRCQKERKRLGGDCRAKEVAELARVRRRRVRPRPVAARLRTDGSVEIVPVEGPLQPNGPVDAVGASDAHVGNQSPLKLPKARFAVQRAVHLRGESLAGRREAELLRLVVALSLYEIPGSRRRPRRWN